MFWRFVGNGVRRTIKITERGGGFRSLHVDGGDTESAQQWRAVHTRFDLRVSRVREVER